MLLYQISVSTIYGKIQKRHTKTINLKQLQCEMEKAELPDWSYSVSDIQDYFEHIIKNVKQWLIISWSMLY